MASRQRRRNPLHGQVGQVRLAQHAHGRAAGRGERGIGVAGEQDDAGAAHGGGEVHRPGVVAHGERRARGDAAEVEQARLPGEVERLGPGPADRVGERLLLRRAGDDGAQAAPVQEVREQAEAVGGPALRRAVRGGARHEQGVGSGQARAALGQPG